MATRPEPRLDDTEDDGIRSLSEDEVLEWLRRGGRTEEERARSRAFFAELEQKFGPWDPEVIERSKALLEEALQAIDDG